MKEIKNVIYIVLLIFVVSSITYLCTAKLYKDRYQLDQWVD